MTFSFDVGAESEDARYAEMLAAHFRTDQRVESLDDYDIASIVPSAVWHTEEPISLGEIPTWCLAILASKHVRVLLSGDGADELFFGYLKFKPLKLFSFLPSSLLSWGYVRGVNGFTRLERGRLANSVQKEFVGPNGNRYLDAASKADVRIKAMLCDASDPDAISRLGQHMDQHYPKLNVLLNNAGIFACHNLAVPSDDLTSFTKEVDVNVAGPIRTVAALIN